MFISGTKFFPMIMQASGILRGTSSGPVFPGERMVYIPAETSDNGTAKVVYTSKDRKFRKTFNALDWLARLVTHIPGRYEQTVRYYGYYSNKSREPTIGTDFFLSVLLGFR